MRDLYVDNNFDHIYEKNLSNNIMYQLRHFLRSLSRETLNYVCSVEFDILAEIPSYAGLRVDPYQFPPVQVTTKTALFLLKRRRRHAQ